MRSTEVILQQMHQAVLNPDDRFIGASQNSPRSLLLWEILSNSFPLASAYKSRYAPSWETALLVLFHITLLQGQEYCNVATCTSISHF